MEATLGWCAIATVRLVGLRVNSAVVQAAEVGFDSHTGYWVRSVFDNLVSNTLWGSQVARHRSDKAVTVGSSPTPTTPTPSWSSPEWTFPCHGKERGFKSHRGR